MLANNSELDGDCKTIYLIISSFCWKLSIMEIFEHAKKEKYHIGYTNRKKNPDVKDNKQVPNGTQKFHLKPYQLN